MGNIIYSNGWISVETENAERIDFIIDGVTTSFSGNSAYIAIPINSKYCRVEAHSQSDSIFSNPIMINATDYHKKKSSTNKVILYMS